MESIQRLHQVDQSNVKTSKAPKTKNSKGQNNMSPEFKRMTKKRDVNVNIFDPSQEELVTNGEKEEQQ